MPRRTNIGTAEATLRLDGTQFASGLKRAARQASGFAGSLGGVTGALGKLGPALAGAASGAALGALVTQIAKASQASAAWGARLVEQASVTGLAASRLDLLRRAFEANGASVAAVDSGFARFNRRLEFARQGLGEYARAFADLNLDPAAFNSTEEAMRAVIERLSELPDSARRGGIAFRLFGTAAQEFDVTLRDGLPALDAEIARQAQLGVVSEQAAKALKDLNQNFTDFANTLKIAVANAVAENKEEIDAIIQLLAALGKVAVREGAALARALSPASQRTDYPEQAREVIAALEEMGAEVSNIERLRLEALAEKSIAEVLFRLPPEELDALREAQRILRTVMDFEPQGPSLAQLGVPGHAELPSAPGAIMVPVVPTIDTETLIESFGRSGEIAVMPFLDGFARRMRNVESAQRLADAFGDPREEIGARIAGQLEARGTDLTPPAEDAEELERRMVEAAKRTQAAWDNVGNELSGLFADVFTATDKWAAALENVLQLALQIGTHLLGGGSFGSFFGFDTNQFGGPVSAGRPTLVGEAGPELFVPSAPGRIVRNDRLGGGGGGSVTVNYNAPITPDQQVMFRNMLRQALAEPDIRQIINPAEAFRG